MGGQNNHKPQFAWKIFTALVPSILMRLRLSYLEHDVPAPRSSDTFSQGLRINCEKASIPATGESVRCPSFGHAHPRGLARGVDAIAFQRSPSPLQRAC